MMSSRARSTFICLFMSAVVTQSLATAASANDLDTLIQSTCIACHDADTETRLDFAALGKDFENEQSFRTWVHVFDRIQSGDMPPAAAAQPSPEVRSAAVKLLEDKLKQVNQQRQQTKGRVPSRRLTRAEYEHTLHDLLGIGGDLAKFLPPENESAAFDVIAANQEMSSVHVRGLLKAADAALDEAIQLGSKPNMAEREIDYFNSRYMKMWFEREVRRGGGTVFRTDHDVVTFRGENFVFRSDTNGFVPPVAGQYRITVKAAAYQPRSLITLSLKRQNDTQGESELFAAWDLVGEDYREVSTTKYLRPDDYIYVSADELEPAPDGSIIYNSQPASKFGGEGVRIRRVTVEGPLEASWPPERTKNLFPGIEWKYNLIGALRGQSFYPELKEPPIGHVRTIVSALASKAFRRKVSESEVDELVELAKPSLDAKHDFVECVRIPLRAILVSPHLVFLSNETRSENRQDFRQPDASPVEDLYDSRCRLSGLALASRLSYFLWRSLPDEELLQIAHAGQLSHRETLRDQVDRMLDHPKCDRFVHEFLDQWLELSRIDATTPDAHLYPEYDDVLRRAMLVETREFFAHLIDEDLSVANLIDSDFTFLNRKMAEHYGIEGVEGEQVRKVTLDENSIRGGILTHASISKVTANGTVTTPVKRGNFVMTNLLGLPPNPPPPGVGSIEPDTRGATTIRETLQKHQNVEACAVCHRKIDPPGFALECFDPIGNFRTRYRNSKGIKREPTVGLRLLHPEYKPGLPVDTSGITADGASFADVREFKRHLYESTEQVVRNVVSRLIEFSTGGEIEFADRDEVERIVLATKDNGYPLRSLIHHVVASRLFLNR